MSEPIYKHDCNACIYLGTDIMNGSPVDIYVCEQISSPTIVVRIGNEGSNYSSYNFIFLEYTDYSSISPMYVLCKRYYEKAKEVLENNKNV